jgi:hypothetical protein
MKLNKEMYKMLSNVIVGFSRENSVNEFNIHKSFISEKLKKRNIFSNDLTITNLSESLPKFWNDFNSSLISEKKIKEISFNNFFKLSNTNYNELFMGCVNLVEENSKKQIKIAEGNLIYITQFRNTKESFCMRLKDAGKSIFYDPYFYDLDNHYLWDAYGMINDIERSLLSEKHPKLTIYNIWNYKQLIGKNN